MRLFSAKSKTGEFLSQSVFRAKLCAWKTSIDSSIQAQESGEVMRRKWRGYGNSYSFFQERPAKIGKLPDVMRVNKDYTAIISLSPMNCLTACKDELKYLAVANICTNIQWDRDLNPLQFSITTAFARYRASGEDNGKYS